MDYRHKPSIGDKKCTAPQFRRSSGSAGAKPVPWRGPASMGRAQRNQRKGGRQNELAGADLSQYPGAALRGLRHLAEQCGSSVGVLRVRPLALAAQFSLSLSLCSTFFRKNYEELKTLNPRTPFVYREAEEMKPFVYARYGAFTPLDSA